MASAAALVAAGATPDAAQSAFSHAKHAPLQMDCVTCHAAVLESTRVEQSPIDKAVCLRCHKTAEFGPVRSVTISKFSHQTHTKLGNIAPVLIAAIRNGSYLGNPGDELKYLTAANKACMACHRGVFESERPVSALYPQMADCLVCHKDIDPPYSCKTCHADNTEFRPASHTPDYMDTHSSGKLKLDKASCATCHGRNFTCKGCHLGN